MSGDDNQRDIEEEPTHSETSDHSNIRAFSFFLLMIGFILLFLAWNDCGSWFGGFPNHFFEFCGGGCFLIILGSLIWAQTDHVEDKAKLEKMNDEEKQLYNKEKKEKDTKLATQLFITFLITLFTIIFLTFGH